MGSTNSAQDTISEKLEGQKRLVILGHIIRTLLTMNFKCYVLFVGLQDKS